MADSAQAYLRKKSLLPSRVTAAAETRECVSARD
jgi:hypothetical protein